jgi:excisionase family DNA binding protein
LAEELLSISEASRVSGLSRNTLHYLIREGRLQAVRMPPGYRRKGWKLYLRKSDVEALKPGDWRRIQRKGPGGAPSEGEEGGHDERQYPAAE